MNRRFEGLTYQTWCALQDLCGKLPVLTPSIANNWFGQLSGKLDPQLKPVPRSKGHVFDSLVGVISPDRPFSISYQPAVDGQPDTILGLDTIDGEAATGILFYAARIGDVSFLSLGLVGKQRARAKGTAATAAGKPTTKRAGWWPFRRSNVQAPSPSKESTEDVRAYWRDRMFNKEGQFGMQAAYQGLIAGPLISLLSDVRVRGAQQASVGVEQTLEGLINKTDFSVSWDARPCIELGMKFFSNSEYDKAVSAYSGAIEIEPGNAAAYVGRGCGYHSLERTNEAIADYAKAAELKPELALAHYALGVTLAQREQLPDALVELSKAISLDATFDHAYYARGLCYKAVGDTSKAVADFRVFLDSKEKSGAIDGTTRAQLVIGLGTASDKDNKARIASIRMVA